MPGTASLSEVWGDIKRHPYVSGGVVFFLGALLIYWYYSGTAAPPAAQQAAGPSAPNEAAAAQLAASLAASSRAQQTAANQVAGAVTISAGQEGTKQLAITTGGSVQLAGIDATQGINLAQIAATKDIDLASIAGTIDLANISATANASMYGKLYDYLNNQITQQYSYLNHVTDVNALNNSAVSNIGTILNQQGQYIGQIGTALGKLGVNVTTPGDLPALSTGGQG